MTPVRFERPWSLYNSGETAGFDAETASALIESGVAVAADEGEKSPEAPAPATTASAAKPRRSRK